MAIINLLTETIGKLFSKKEEILQITKKSSPIADSGCFTLEDLLAAYYRIFKTPLDPAFFLGHFKEALGQLPFFVIPHESGTLSDNVRFTVLIDKKAGISRKKGLEIQHKLVEGTTKYTLCEEDSSMDSEVCDDRRSGGLIEKEDTVAGEDMAAGENRLKTDQVASLIKKPHETHTGRFYDDISSDSTQLISRFTSPFTPKKVPSRPVSIRTKLGEIFGQSLVIPVDMFQTVYCEVHGQAINWRTVPCQIPKHAHPTLSKFLRCFDDIFELRQLRRLYVVSRSEEIARVMRQRLAEYSRYRGGPMSLVCLEALCANIFVTRVTTALSDFLSLFEGAYGISLVNYLSGVAPQEALCALRSPNIVVVNKNNEFTVTLCPTHHSTFIEWMDSSAHRLVAEIEKVVLGTVPSGPSEGLGCEFFAKKKTLDGLDALLKISDLNIPRQLQIRTRYPPVAGLKPSGLWRYLQENVNFDDLRGL